MYCEVIKYGWGGGSYTIKTEGLNDAFDRTRPILSPFDNQRMIPYRLFFLFSTTARLITK